MPQTATAAWWRQKTVYVRSCAYRTNTRIVTRTYVIACEGTSCEFITRALPSACQSLRPSPSQSRPATKPREWRRVRRSGPHNRKGGYGRVCAKMAGFCTSLIVVEVHTWYVGLTSSNFGKPIWMLQCSCAVDNRCVWRRYEAPRNFLEGVLVTPLVSPKPIETKKNILIVLLRAICPSI